MRKALIVIQDAQITAEQVKQLDAIVKRHYQQHVSDEKLLTIWNRVPQGQAFTKYEDSRSSLVTMECQNGLAQNQRVALMQALEKDWRTVTGQHPDEVMLAVVDEDLFADVFASSQNRLSPLGRIHLILSMLKAFINARLTGAPVQFNPNL